MKITHSLEALKAALESAKTLNAREIVENFLKFEHSCAGGTYCAAILNPKDGDIHHVNEASRCCSADEYFGESGVLSRTTLLSSTRSHWSPSPDDGFEWTEGKDYVHSKDHSSGWITAQAYNDLDEEDKGKYTEWFSVGDVPVDGWLNNADHQIELVEKRIQELIESIESEIEEIKTEAGE